MSTAQRYLNHAAELRAKSDAEQDKAAAKQLAHFAECYVKLAGAEAMSVDSPEWIDGICNERQTRGHIVSNRFH